MPSKNLNRDKIKLAVLFTPFTYSKQLYLTLKWSLGNKEHYSAMTISLREVTKDNRDDIILLEVTKEQEEFVALNAESIAGSKFNEHYVNRAVYFNEDLVSFIQYFPNYEDEKPNEIYIDQFMIDVPHQGKGYGTKAIELALDKIKLRADCKAI